MELLRAAVQLLRPGQIHQAAVVHTVDDAAELDVLAAQRGQVADIACVLGQAGDGDSAVFVLRLGTADIEEACAIAQLRDVIYVGCDADVFAAVARRVRGWMAGCGVKLNEAIRSSSKVASLSVGSAHAARLCDCRELAIPRVRVADGTT